MILLLALVCVFVACDGAEEKPNVNGTVVDSQGVAYRPNAENTAYVVIGMSSHDRSNIVIPEKVDGKNVVSIQAGAFKNDDHLKSVDLPSTISSIGDGAFANCKKLTRVTYTELNISVIGKDTFKGCASLSDFDIPSSVVTIGDNAFDGCKVLQSVVIPSGITSLGNNAFRDCIALESAIFDENSNLTVIGEETFCGCMNLSTLVLPENVKVIKESAFFGCSALEAIDLPDVLENIRSYAFYGCALLKEVTIPDSVVTIERSAFNNCQALKKVNFASRSGLSMIGEHSFENCIALSSFDVPDGVTIIGEEAFYNCGKLQNITFGYDSLLKTISKNAFVGCNSLQSLDLPKEVTSIGEGAFYGCKSLYFVMLPDDSNLVEIGDNAFYNCDSLMGVVFGESSSLIKVGAKAFYDCDRLITVEFGSFSPLQSIGEKAFYDCGSLFTMTLPLDLNSVGKNAFTNCFRLVEVNDLSTAIDVTLGETTYGGVAAYAKIVANDPNYETKIDVDENGYVTYEDSTNVSLVGYIGGETGLVIPLKVTDVNKYAFYKNTAIRSVLFEEDSRLRKIDVSAFESCTSLKTIQIPTTVLSIEDRAFKNCKAINNIYFDARACQDFVADNEIFYSVGTSTSGVNVTLGREVTRLPSYLFSGKGTLPRVRRLYYSDYVSLEHIGEYAFSNNRYMTTLYLPSTLLTMGEGAFSNTVLTNVTIEDECMLYNLPKDAFKNCTKLVSVYFGENSILANIEESAFESCTALIDVTFGELNGIMTIGKYAFKDCINLTSFRLPEWSHDIGEDAFYNCYRLTEIIDQTEHIDVTIGTDDNGGVGKYALVVHEGFEGSMIEIDDFGYVILHDNEESILVNYVGLETELIVPQSVTCINDFALKDLKKITSVKFEEDSRFTTFGNNVFMGDEALLSVEIPQNTIAIGENIFEGCTELVDLYYNAIDCTGIDKNTVLLNGVGDAGVNVTIGNKVVIVPQYFLAKTEDKSDYKVSGITFEEGSTCLVIGDYAFEGVNSIATLDIADSVEIIGGYVFKDCTLLTAINFGKDSKLESMGEKIFENCPSMTTLKLPKYLESIDATTFDGMSKVLTSISVDSENENYHARGNCLIKTEGATLVLGCRNSTIPDYVVNIANGAFKNCSELKNIVIPESVKVIGDEAFYWCINVENITFQGEGLETIGQNAFVYCSKVNRVTLPSSLKRVGAYAFLYCSGLKTILYKGDSEAWSKIELNERWNYRVGAANVMCTDKNVAI